MALIKNVDGVDVEMTPEEEAEFLASLPPPPTEPVPQSITRRQCARQLLDMGLIDGPEALSMTKYGEPPSVVASVFSMLSTEDALSAAIDFAADTYTRSNTLLISIMLAIGATEAGIDLFFIEAAKL